ncbi:YafY family protein [Sulfurimonas sp.]|jgi:predicted DNA-binding transcriptional regulator YafY|uniref:helix-turn-helix transcriptional regulator n=1 Tax=Sulfurimonas sp. TaxID=2022749 RepID=UPI0025F70302|nr:WYL domain-containing transcriptional regulator [Sulfurimonas sp.]MBT5935643.1 WYL domain-containing transcriptional regulator [Sulfurimonas sp.]
MSIREKMSIKPTAQYERHNQILERLNSGEILSITELSREWDIQTKTLQRDFKKLMEGSYGVIRADDGKRFSISKKKTTSKEATTAVNMLDSLSKDIGGKFYIKAKTALSNIQSHIESPFYTRIDVEDISDKMNLVQQLEIAISKRKMVTFKYKRWYKPDDIKIYEGVKPYKIVIFDGFFYLFCQHNDYYPKFYLKEMSAIVVSDETFEYKDKVLSSIEKAQDIWFDPSKEPFEVILYLDNTARVYFERKPIKGQSLKKYENGSCELTTYMTNKEEVFSILKRWLPHIKVIEPPELQKEFDIMLNEYVNF